MVRTVTWSLGKQVQICPNAPVQHWVILALVILVLFLAIMLEHLASLGQSFWFPTSTGNWTMECGYDQCFSSPCNSKVHFSFSTWQLITDDDDDGDDDDYEEDEDEDEDEDDTNSSSMDVPMNPFSCSLCDLCWGFDESDLADVQLKPKSAIFAVPWRSWRSTDSNWKYAAHLCSFFSKLSWNDLKCDTAFARSMNWRHVQSIICHKEKRVESIWCIPLIRISTMFNDVPLFSLCITISSCPARCWRIWCPGGRLLALNCACGRGLTDSWEVWQAGMSRNCHVIQQRP